MTIAFDRHQIDQIRQKAAGWSWEKIVLLVSTVLSMMRIGLALHNDVIVVYGDAESHLNISKRVVDSLTPGMAQLGGIWLPLPHVLMLPLIWSDWMWRTGLAGAIISGAFYVISSVFIYKLTKLLTQQRWAGVLAWLVFSLNPGILYMQSTPMTELPLIGFFTLSSYFFIKYLLTDGQRGDFGSGAKSDGEYSRLMNLLFAAFFGFCATLSRYDGWLLVLAEAAILTVFYLVRGRKYWREMEGKVILYSTMAFLGIGLWLLWAWLILGDPLYFTNSQFSAKSQQQGWLAKGQLPAYQNMGLSFLYYLVTTMNAVGPVTLVMFVIGLTGYLKPVLKMGRWWSEVKANVRQLISSGLYRRGLIVGLLMVPFVFYVVTLYMGQSIIFIPHLTPTSFEWTLFNVRYGLMMVPTVAVFVGMLFAKSKSVGKLVIIASLVLQSGLFLIGYSRNLAMEDGVRGLSTAYRLDAEVWLAQHYDNGLVLIDDYSRLLSIIRSGIPMQNVIYVGTRPYWEESLEEPEKYARWIIIQKDDEVWDQLYAPEDKRGRLYAHFEKVYTSKEILIFRRTET